MYIKIKSLNLSRADVIGRVMINIEDLASCCGCGACYQKCPKNCISMQEDSEGFLYPKVELSLCIECGLCEKVCPVINQGVIKEPLHVYVAMNKDEEIRQKSSSGGIFTLLAERVIGNGGVVFGAIFNDNWEVVHSYTESMDGLEFLRTSKYVQSNIGDTYKLTKVFLDAGREVLFVGTPCQIGGLRLFLNKDYEKLLSVDILCHGVPSPKVWRMYLDDIIRTKCGVGKNKVSLSLKEISNISFRDKEFGWKKYGFKVWGKSASKADQNTVSRFGYIQKNHVLFSEPSSVNIYMRGFINDLYLRPSCNSCPSKLGKSGSDITIADYWNIGTVAPEFDDDKGAGLILINSEKGNREYPIELTNYIETGYEECQRGNGGFKVYISDHPYRKEFFAGLDCCENLSEHILSSLHIPKKTLIERVRNKLKSIVKRVIKR